MGYAKGFKQARGSEVAHRETMATSLGCQRIGQVGFTTACAINSFNLMRTAVQETVTKSATDKSVLYNLRIASRYLQSLELAAPRSK